MSYISSLNYNISRLYIWYIFYISSTSFIYSFKVSLFSPFHYSFGS